MDKLKSRKFLLAIVGGLIIILNKELGWGLTEETIWQFVAVIITYLTANVVRKFARPTK